jgi:hypothetical protein
MTVLEVLQSATEAAGITTDLQFADIREFNTFVDSFSFNQYPVNVVEPFQDNGNWRNGGRRGTIVLRGWVLTRISEDTNDYRSKKLEEDYLNEMRLRAKVFIQAVINSQLTDPEAQNITDSIRPEYAFLNMHTFGVSYQLNWPIKEFICLPHGS